MSTDRFDWPALRARHVVHEDDAVLALDKPAGVSVTGERHDTDLVRLAADAGEQLFPVHRIDKVTSGLVLFAKDVAVHGGLTRQFNRRTVGKAYLAITRAAGAPGAETAEELPETGTIDLPLSVGRKNRVRIAAPRGAITLGPGGRWTVPASAVREGVRSYPSETRFARLWTDGSLSVVLARPVTGRRHQIRVHLAWIGHSIVGDPLFEKAPATRTFLHAWRLAFDASWSDGHRVDLAADPPADFWRPLGTGGPAPAPHPATLLARADAVRDAIGSSPTTHGES